MSAAPPPFTLLQRCLFLFFVSLVTLLIVLDYSIANIAIPYIAGGLSVSVEEGIYVITFFFDRQRDRACADRLAGPPSRSGATRSSFCRPVHVLLLDLRTGAQPSHPCQRPVHSRPCSGTDAPLEPSHSHQRGQAGTPGKGFIGLEHDGHYGTCPRSSAWRLHRLLVQLVVDFLYQHPDWDRMPHRPLVAFAQSRNGDRNSQKRHPWNFSCFGRSHLLSDLSHKGQQWDWWNSSAICAAFITCIVTTVFFIIRELGTPYPFFQIRLLKIFSFSFAILLLFVTYGIYFGSIVIVPLWLQEFMGYDAIKAGIAVAPLGIGPILLTLTTPLLIKKIGNLLTLALSFLAFAFSAFYTCSFLTSVDIEHIGFSRFFMGLGFVCYITPLIQISIQHILPRDLSSSVGIFHFFRALSGAVGASVFTTIWDRRSIFHHERVGSALTLFNPFTPQTQDPAVLQALNGALDQQASMLAINDAFYLMGWLYVGSLAFLMGYFVWIKWTKRESVQRHETVHSFE